MLAINKYTKEYIDECRSKIELQLSTYHNVTAKAKHLDRSNDRSLHHTIDVFEHRFLNNMVVVLDAMFMHRTRNLEGKDGNPLNEVRVLSNSILNGNKLLKDNSIKLDPSTSVLKYKTGDDIKLSVSDFEKLSHAYFAEIKRKFSSSE